MFLRTLPIRSLHPNNHSLHPNNRSLLRPSNFSFAEEYRTRYDMTKKSIKFLLEPLGIEIDLQKLRLSKQYNTAQANKIFLTKIKYYSVTFEEFLALIVDGEMIPLETKEHCDSFYLAIEAEINKHKEDRLYNPLATEEMFNNYMLIL